MRPIFIDKFIGLLNESNIGKLIEQEQKSKGINGHNQFKLIATIIYCFSQFKSSIRENENLCVFDFRVMYIMKQY